MTARDAEIAQVLGDEEYPFRLGIKQIEELQEKRDQGPFRLFRALCSGDWYIQDITEILRLGLIGGGMKPSSAVPLVKRYVEEYPLTEHLDVATAVLGVALFGPDDEKPGKPKAGEEIPTPSRETKSVSPDCTETAR